MYIRGTWQTFAARTENELQKISKYGISKIKAVTISIIILLLFFFFFFFFFFFIYI